MLLNGFLGYDTNSSETQDMWKSQCKLYKCVLEHLLENSDGSRFINAPGQAVPDGQSSNCKWFVTDDFVAMGFYVMWFVLGWSGHKTFRSSCFATLYQWGMVEHSHYNICR